MAREAFDPNDIAVVHDPQIDSCFPWLSKNFVLRELAKADAPAAEGWLAKLSNRRAEIARLSSLYLDGAPDWAVRVRLEALGPQNWPRTLMGRYDAARLRDDRLDCVYRAIGLARDSVSARQLGLKAIADRSWTVRSRAYQLLAYSLDRSIIPALREARKTESRPNLLESIDAAVNAIEKQNHNLYLDRRETDRIGWAANPWDARDPAIQHAMLKSILKKRREGWETKL